MANISRKISYYRLNDLVHDPFGNYQTASGKLISVPAVNYYHDGDLVRIKKRSLSRLRRAATYASFAGEQDIYVNKARQYGASGYSMALVDFMVPPQVLAVDLNAWTGEIGEKIRVKAKDNIVVAGMLVMISDVGGNILEAEQAEQFSMGSLWWLYTTRSKVELEPFPSIKVIVRDLAGNKGTFTIP